MVVSTICEYYELCMHVRSSYVLGIEKGLIVLFGVLATLSLFGCLAFSCICICFFSFNFGTSRTVYLLSLDLRLTT